MPGPFSSDVHVPRPLDEAEAKKLKGKVAKGEMVAPLYVSRVVENAAEIIAWAKAQGFAKTLEPSDLHVTVVYSRSPVDWFAAGDAWSDLKDGGIRVAPGGPRAVCALGDKGAVVLMFASSSLAWSHKRFEEHGASWDYDEYQPHITITYDGAGVDLDAIKAYQGEIILGPERFEELVENWQESIVEKKMGEVRKSQIDAEHGLVFGFAVVCNVDGKPYFDRQIDKATGKPRPDHIPEDAMLDAALDFMKNSRAAKQMHRGEVDGSVPFAIPLTTEMRDFIVKNNTTGLLIGMLPSPDALVKFKRGDYTGFSIGGDRIIDEEID